MSTKKLQEEGRALTARLASFAKDFEENVSISEDEKKSAYETLKKEFEANQAALSRSEGASAMQAKLAAGGCGNVMDVKGRQVEKYEMASPLSPLGRKALAMEALRDGQFHAVFGFKDGFRKKMDAVRELGVKTGGSDNAPANTATAGTGGQLFAGLPAGGPSPASDVTAVASPDAFLTDNLLGEGLYGQTGPAPAGAQPFLPGAFGQGIMPDWRPGIVEQLLYQITIPDLISSFATTAPNISYLTEQNLNLTADAVAEAGTYGFSSVAVERAYAQVGKIANALTISDEAIADAPTLYNFVQGRLLAGLARQEEVQILAGPGYPGVGGLLSFNADFTASNSTSVYGATSAAAANVQFPATGTVGAGVVPQTVSLAYGRVVTGAGSSYPDPLTVSLNLKDAAVDIELAVFQSPTAHIMHPRDWQRLETAQDANQQFMNTSMFGNVYGVSRGPVKSLWGVPVVTTPLIPVGTIITGWFDPQTVQVARRQGVQMQMTNANESDFIQGLITVRADERLGLLCYRPTAFEVTKLVAGS